MADRIVIQMIGAEEDGGDVRLEDFADQLQAVSNALRQTEVMLSGESEPALYYRVVALSYSSPASVAIEPVARLGIKTRVKPSSVTREFGRSLHRLRRAKTPPRKMPVSTVRAFGDIGATLTKHVRSLKITTPPPKLNAPQTEVDIDIAFSAHISELLEAEDTVVYGSVSGWLDRVSVHTRNQFEVYPAFGQPKIQCLFKDVLLQKVRDALGHFVTVNGDVRYKPWAEFAHSIEATQIDVHQDASRLPNLDSIRGMAPEATEELSENFVNKLRHEGWR